jgi:hypothetical protein
MSSDAAKAQLHREALALIAGVDAKVDELEQTWGVGRLMLLVSDKTRERFWQAQELWTRACWQVWRAPLMSVQETRDLAAMMLRAWSALDAEARAAGQQPRDPEVWEVGLDDERGILLLCRTMADAHRVSRQVQREGLSSAGSLKTRRSVNATRAPVSSAASPPVSAWASWLTLCCRASTIRRPPGWRWMR